MSTAKTNTNQQKWQQELIDLWKKVIGNGQDKLDAEDSKRQLNIFMSIPEPPGDKALEEDVADPVCRQTGNSANGKLYKAIMDSLIDARDLAADKRQLTES